MAELSDHARQLLAKQREKYLASLPGKRAELSALWDSRTSQELELIDAVHRIAGSAGLHGLTELQACAVKAEQALRDSSIGEQAQEAAVTRLLEELSQNAAQAD